MSFKVARWVFCITILHFSVFHLNSAKAQIDHWKKHSNVDMKFNFFYPPNWIQASMPLMTNR